MRIVPSRLSRCHIADAGNGRIRRVGRDGILTTWAGSVVGSGDLDDGGLAARAVFSLLDHGTAG